jgi:hypothetical protein
MAKAGGPRQSPSTTNRPEHSPDAASNAAIYDFFEHFLK